MASADGEVVTFDVQGLLRSELWQAVQACTPEHLEDFRHAFERSWGLDPLTQLHQIAESPDATVVTGDLQGIVLDDAAVDMGAVSGHPDIAVKRLRPDTWFALVDGDMLLMADTREQLEAAAHRVRARQVSEDLALPELPEAAGGAFVGPALATDLLKGFGPSTWLLRGMIEHGDVSLSVERDLHLRVELDAVPGVSSTLMRLTLSSLVGLARGFPWASLGNLWLPWILEDAEVDELSGTSVVLSATLTRERLLQRLGCAPE